MTRTIWQDLILLILLIGSLFTCCLANHPLTVPDEARYCEIPREMLVTHNFVTPRINGIKYFEKPPLFYWLQAASLHTFGFSEWACRILNAFIALLGCLLTYLTANKLFNRKTAWLASLILSTSTLYFVMGRTVTLDMTLTFFLTATLCSLLTALQRPPDNPWRKRLFYLAYVTAALAVLTKGLIGLLFPGAIVVIWLVITGRWFELKKCYLISGLMIFLAITLPWHYLMQQANPEFFHYYFIRQQFSRYLTNVAHRMAPLWFYPLVVIVGFFPWTGFLYGAFTKTIKKNNALLFLKIWSVFILLFFCFSHSKLVPYILPCLPPLAILVAHYLIDHEFKAATKNGWIGIGFIIFINILFMVAIATQIVPSVTVNYPMAQFWSHVIIGILLINSLILPLIYKKGNVILTFTTQFICSITFLLSIAATIPYIALPSVKSLALKVKPLLKPNTMVATYDYYYQDLPFYLQRNISIVNWKGELAFGAEHQPHKSLLMIDSTTLWQQWQSPQVVYLFMPVAIWQNLVKPLPYHFYIFATIAKNIVVTNHRMN